MKLLRKPLLNAFVVSLISLFYGLVFHVTALNYEFTGMLGYDPKRGGTLTSPFWNGWSVFLREGNHRFIGYGFLLAAAVIVVLSFIRRKDYDEYQIGFLEKGLIVSGISMLFLIPFWFLSILEDPCYIVEYAMLVVVVHWTVVLAADLLFMLIRG